MCNKCGGRRHIAKDCRKSSGTIKKLDLKKSDTLILSRKSIGGRKEGSDSPAAITVRTVMMMKELLMVCCVMSG